MPIAPYIGDLSMFHITGTAIISLLFMGKDINDYVFS